MATSARFGFQLLEEGQAQADIPLNTNLNELETLICCQVIDRVTSTPPGSPADGDAYLVKATGTDEWDGQDGNIAYYYSGWYFITPKPSLLIFDLADLQWLRWDGTHWVPVTDGAYKTITYAATITIDPNAAAKQHVTLTGNVTLTLTAGSYDGQLLTLRLKQDGTGSRLLTVTVGLGTTFADTTLTTTANKTDIIRLEWFTALAKWVVVGFIKGV